MTLNPGDPFEYNGEWWTISLVTSEYVTIEKGKRWKLLKR